ncbi:hypothetical protein F5Y03DRAFT_389929 [Xylaria venustula]|nr:hypothetical protein F5Y03DRAFT_389929 [Xylaria venustula]
MDQDHIDGLLERYLHLLHDYTTLREELTALQTGMYQNIARANFAAERGLRFGQDYYDDRMQASRRLAISYDNQRQDHGQEPSERQNGQTPGVLGGTVASFAIIGPASVRAAASTAEEVSGASVEAAPNPPDPETGAEEESGAPNIEVCSAPTPPSQRAGTDAVQSRNCAEDTTTGETTGGSPSRIAEKEGTATPQKSRSNDPLRWFGLLTPMPLRQAQTQTIRAVEHVIPRLASLNAEMAAVEIEVRRARKRRAKAEAAASRLS